MLIESVLKSSTRQLRWTVHPPGGRRWTSHMTVDGWWPPSLPAIRCRSTTSYRSSGRPCRSSYFRRARPRWLDRRSVSWSRRGRWRSPAPDGRTECRRRRRASISTEACGERLDDGGRSGTRSMILLPQHLAKIARTVTVFSSTMSNRARTFRSYLASLRVHRCVLENTVRVCVCM